LWFCSNADGAFQIKSVQKSEKAYDGKSKTFTPADHIQLKANSCGCVFEMGFNGPDVRTTPFRLTSLRALRCPLQTRQVSSDLELSCRTTRSDG
jgi:hypothetical protein